MNDITAKQRVAIAAVMSGATKTEAIRKAGYSEKTPVTLVFKGDAIRDEMARQRALLSADMNLQIKDVLNGLMDAVGAAQNSLDLVAAWREIGKILGAYEHAKKIEIDVQSRIEHIHHSKQLERMSDADLVKLAELGDDFVLEGEYEEIKRDGDTEEGVVQREVRGEVEAAPVQKREGS